MASDTARSFDRHDTFVAVNGDALSMDKSLRRVANAEDGGYTVFACDDGSVCEDATDVSYQARRVRKELRPGGCREWAYPVSYTHLTLPTTPYV